MQVKVVYCEKLGRRGAGASGAALKPLGEGGAPLLYTGPPRHGRAGMWPWSHAARRDARGPTAIAGVPDIGRRVLQKALAPGRRRAARHIMPFFAPRRQLPGIGGGKVAMGGTPAGMMARCVPGAALPAPDLPRRQAARLREGAWWQ